MAIGDNDLSAVARITDSTPVQGAAGVSCSATCDSMLGDSTLGCSVYSLRNKGRNSICSTCFLISPLQLLPKSKHGRNQLRSTETLSSGWCFVVPDFCLRYGYLCDSRFSFWLLDRDAA